MSGELPKIAVLFSGGTDSTASAALLTESFGEIHLLTFDRLGFHNVRNSGYNFGKLSERFSDRKFIHRIFETTAMAKYMSNHRRWRYVFKYGFLTLQNCGFCALLNHVCTIAYCLKNGISDSADGITRDWPFFPAHMDRVIDRFRVLYGHFGIKYHTPVLHFDIDKPMTYIDKIKGGAGAVPDETANTTGRLLHRLGLSDRDNYKGTELDKKVQARCFQFVLPNIYIYWIFRGNERWDQYESAVLDYFGKRIEDSKILIERFFEKGEKRELFAFLDEPGVLT